MHDSVCRMRLRAVRSTTPMETPSERNGTDAFFREAQKALQAHLDGNRSLARRKMNQVLNSQAFWKAAPEVRRPVLEIRDTMRKKFSDAEREKQGNKAHSDNGSGTEDSNDDEEICFPDGFLHACLETRLDPANRKRLAELPHIKEILSLVEQAKGMENARKALDPILLVPPPEPIRGILFSILQGRGLLGTIRPDASPLDDEDEPTDEQLFAMATRVRQEKGGRKRRGAGKKN